MSDAATVDATAEMCRITALVSQKRVVQLLHGMNFANFKILQNLQRTTTENNSIRILTIGGKYVIGDLQDVQLPIGPVRL